MQKLIEVYNSLAPKLSFLGQIYIAGGAVRDTLLGRKPKDYDLFILGEPSETVAYPDKFKQFCELQLSLKTFENNLEWHKSEPFLLTNIQLDSETEVQIMHRNLNTVHELLDTFDWDISQFAFGADGITAKRAVATIKEGEYLNLHKITFPASTLRRGYRFSERFGMRIHHKDLVRLCGQVAATNPPNQADWII
jgi:hypothetical protein